MEMTSVETIQTEGIAVNKKTVAGTIGPICCLLMSTFIRQWQKYIIQARLGLHTSKLKYSKTHEKVIKRNEN